jgi:hypothetical protein
LRGIEISERAHALDQCNFGPPHPRETKLGISRSAGALELWGNGGRDASTGANTSKSGAMKSAVSSDQGQLGF